jgi:hypothetical protein
MELKYDFDFMRRTVADTAAELANERLRKKYLEEQVLEGVETMSGKALATLRAEWNPVVVSTLPSNAVSLFIQPQYAFLFDIDDYKDIRDIVIGAVREAAKQNAQSFVGAILYDMIQKEPRLDYEIE